MIAPDPDQLQQFNFKVLSQIDPFVSEILFSTSHVVIYQLDTETNKWNYKGVKGPLFVIKRKRAPFYMFVVLNRIQIETLLEPISCNMTIENNDSIVSYMNEGGLVHGIWFYESLQIKDNFFYTIGRIVRKLASLQNRNDQIVNPTNSPRPISVPRESPPSLPPALPRTNSVPHDLPSTRDKPQPNNPPAEEDPDLYQLTQSLRNALFKPEVKVEENVPGEGKSTQTHQQLLTQLQIQLQAKSKSPTPSPSPSPSKTPLPQASTPKPPFTSETGPSKPLPGSQSPSQVPVPQNQPVNILQKLLNTNIPAPQNTYSPIPPKATILPGPPPGEATKLNNPAPSPLVLLEKERKTQPMEPNDKKSVAKLLFAEKQEQKQQQQQTGGLLSKEELKELLLRLVQNDQFIDIVYNTYLQEKS
eukprot:TRINITY_DN6044_c0_g1_i2.p1 TRINITY_DN6044_c0_g1~~TRINITY_DN6044_c0_g1_i2.p1  ORF type:complete len:416 (-),score=115.45 TRINITY_DN6044_c0_g1_i2:104-1351(-)